MSTNYHLTGLFIHLLQLNGNKLSNGHNNDKKGNKAGLQITAGQWTISGQKKALSCQILNDRTFCLFFHASNVLQTFTFFKYDWSRSNNIDVHKTGGEKLGGGDVGEGKMATRSRSFTT